MIFKVAKVSDIDGVLQLQKKYQIDTIAEEDKKDGFVTTSFTREQLTKLIEEEQGLFIAENQDGIVAYVMAASWQYWSAWPLFAYMIQDLPNLEYRGQRLSVENSYQYGPICVDKSVRGSGVLEEIFELARKEMAKRFSFLVTFINKINPRSYEAHTRKLGLELLQEFDYNNNSYYELIYDVSKEGKKDSKQW
jgi:hypothetical protein